MVFAGLPQIGDNASADATSSTCANPVAEATLNHFPVTYTDTAEFCKDYPALDARLTGGQYSQSAADHSNGLAATEGQEIYVLSYIHNGAANNLGDSNIAKAVRIETDVPANVGTSHTLSTRFAGSNTNQVNGSFTITTPDNMKLEAVPNSGELYDYTGANVLRSGFNVTDGYTVGDMRACFEYSVFVRFKVRVVRVNVAVPPVAPPAQPVTIINNNQNTNQNTLVNTNQNGTGNSASTGVNQAAQQNFAVNRGRGTSAGEVVSNNQNANQNALVNTNQNSGSLAMPAITHVQLSKKAWNDTRNADAQSVTAQRDDYITYTLTASNPDGGIVQNFVITDDLSGVLPFADMVDNGGGTVNGNTITYPAVSIAAGSSVSKTFRVRVKHHLSPSLSYVMRNTYGNTVTVNIGSAPGVVTYTAPKTGAAETSAVVFAGLVTSGFVLFRKRRQLMNFIFA
jgi:LPXTG-motif cell wall-anchored protein